MEGNPIVLTGLSGKDSRHRSMACVLSEINFILMLLPRQTQLEALREQWIFFTRQGKSIYR